MKRKLLITVLLIGISYVYASTNRFGIDTSSFSFSSNSKKKNVTSEFNENYKLTYNVSSSNEELKKNIVLLSKKIIYLLLGDGKKADETAEEYYKRKSSLMEFRYYVKAPEDPDSPFGVDINSQEFIDSNLSSNSINYMLEYFDLRVVSYDSIGSIKVAIAPEVIAVRVPIINVTIKKENYDNPMEFVNKKTNLVMYYLFKKLDNNYKLAYLYGVYMDDLNGNFENMASSENTKSISIFNSYDSKLSAIYDFSKLKSLDENMLNKLYRDNSNNLLILNAYYNSQLVTSANGFLISDGLVVTTWSFLEKALINSQYFVVKNSAGKIYDIDGIVTANPESDIAVIKLKEKIPTTIALGNIDSMNIEDPVITISSKTGVGFTIQTGILISKDGYLQNILPLQESDAGSPLYNDKGLIIGMNTSKSINSSISMALDSKVLFEVKNKFSTMDFSTIDTVPFNELKEKFYYTEYSKESIINSIPSSKWKMFRKVGNIEKSINMELRKASYDNNVVSLRYYNSISEYISSMQLASSFKAELNNAGFKQTLDTETKCIYTNRKYKVIIMDEFDYLIVVMVKL